MTAKTYLEQIRHYERRIMWMNEEIERLEAIATSTSPSLTGMPHNPSPMTSRLEEAVIKILDKETELRQEKAKLDTLRSEVVAMIAQIDNPEERQVLYRRYVESKTWEDIAAEMIYSIGWIYKIHKNALASFDKILKKIVQDS